MCAAAAIDESPLSRSSLLRVGYKPALRTSVLPCPPLKVPTKKERTANSPFGLASMATPHARAVARDCSERGTVQPLHPAPTPASSVPAAAPTLEPKLGLAAPASPKTRLSSRCPACLGETPPMLRLCSGLALAKDPVSRSSEYDSPWGALP